MLLDSDHIPLPSRSLQSPRWMGSLKILACQAPNKYSTTYTSGRMAQLPSPAELNVELAPSP